MIAFCSMLLSSYSSKTILPNSVRTYIQDICKNFEFEKGSRIAIKIIRKQVAVQLKPVRNTKLCNYKAPTCNC